MLALISIHLGGSVPPWITAGAALAGFIVALCTILVARRNARRTLAYSYVAELGTPEFRALDADAGAFFACKKPPPGVTLAAWQQLDRPERERQQWAYWEQLWNSWDPKDIERVLTLLALPNQFEDIAGAYNMGLIDRTVVKTHIEVMVEDFWLKAGWWLDEMRRDPTDNSFQDLAKMLTHLNKRKRPRWHRPKDGRIKRVFF